MPRCKIKENILRATVSFDDVQMNDSNDYFRNINTNVQVPKLFC